MTPTTQYLSNVKFHNGGYCWQLARLAGARSWKPRKFYAVFATFEHPSVGTCAIDTGYGPAIQGVKTWSSRLLNTLIPIPSGQAFEKGNYLATHHSIEAESIKLVFISHFHTDHIGGLSLFPNSQFVCRMSSFEALHRQGVMGQMKNGFIPELIPHDFRSRSRDVGPFQLDHRMPEFMVADCFGDGSLLAIDMPGHAHGHTGYFLRTSADTGVLYAVDAFWDGEAWENGWRLPWVSRRAVQDIAAYDETQQKLLQFRRRTGIEPRACHCPRMQQYVTTPTH